MAWWQIVTLIGLGAWPLGAAAEEAALADFFGTWKGVEVSVAGDRSFEVAPSDLDVQIEEAGDAGFQIRGFGMSRDPDNGELVRRPVDATFAPTELPGVFAFDPTVGQSLLSSLFADPATGNPLEGDTLLWARLEDDTLHVYSLAIDHNGGFELHHTTARAADDIMDTRYELRFENEQVEIVGGRLERKGG
jgi:hypothetical protein